MRNLKLLFLFAAIVAVGVVSSCGDSGGDTPKSDQELTIEALSGSWTLNTGSSTFGNLTDTPTATVSVSSTGVSITDGTLSDYVSSISFTVSDAGALTGASATLASNEITLSGDVTASINDALDKITVSFSTEAARMAGTGSFVLVFDKAS